MRILRPLLLIATVLISLAVLGTVIAQQTGGGSKNAYIVTHIDVMPNFVADTTKLLREFAAESRKDPGAIRVEVLEQDGRPNHYTVVEVWQSRQAFEAHSAAEHTRRFREKLQPMLGSPLDERLHDLVQ
jgi:quinol monooxygenase YgiN